MSGGTIYEATTGWPLMVELAALSSVEMVLGVQLALGRPETEHWPATAAMLCDRLLEADAQVKRLQAEWDAVVAALGTHGHPGLSPSECVLGVVERLRNALEEIELLVQHETLTPSRVQP